MPRTEHLVDVWSDDEGHILNRVMDPAHYYEPPRDELRAHKWRAWRYRNSECDFTGRVPERAYIAAPHSDEPLQWYDASRFVGNKSERWMEVFRLPETEYVHELMPHASGLRYRLPATEDRPRFLIDAEINKAFQLAEALRLTIYAHHRQSPPVLGSHEVRERLEALTKCIERDERMAFIFRDTVAYLCDLHHVRYNWEDELARTIKKRLAADLASHWSQFGQHRDAQRDKEDKALRNAPETQEWIAHFERDLHDFLAFIKPQAHAQIDLADVRTGAAHLLNVLDRFVGVSNKYRATHALLRARFDDGAFNRPSNTRSLYNEFKAQFDRERRLPPSTRTDPRPFSRRNSVSAHFET